MTLKLSVTKYASERIFVVEIILVQFCIKTNRRRTQKGLRKTTFCWISFVDFVITFELGLCLFLTTTENISLKNEWITKIHLWVTDIGMNLYWRIVNLLNPKCVRRMGKPNRKKENTYNATIIIEANCNWNRINVNKITRFLFENGK